MKTINVVRKPNGDTAFRIPVEGLEHVDVVTLQKDGEIRWASIGPMTVEQAVMFNDALRIALSFIRDLLSVDAALPMFGTIFLAILIFLANIW